MNPDALSLAESESIKEHLNNFDMKVESLILNKYEEEEEKLKLVISSFPEVRVTILMKEKEEIIGLNKLKKIPELFSQEVRKNT